MLKIAQTEDRRDAPGYGRNAEDVAETARQASEMAADAARRSAETTSDAGQMLVDIFTDQTRQNMRMAAALTRAVDWSKVAEIQKDFIGESFARAGQIGEFYRQILQAGTAPRR